MKTKRDTTPKINKTCVSLTKKKQQEIVVVVGNSICLYFARQITILRHVLQSRQSFKHSQPLLLFNALSRKNNKKKDLLSFLCCLCRCCCCCFLLFAISLFFLCCLIALSFLMKYKLLVACVIKNMAKHRIRELYNYQQISKQLQHWQKLFNRLLRIMSSVWLNTP